MKLWEKGYTLDDIVERFTIGNDRELDLELAPYDVQASMAHAKMLGKIGILTEQELAEVLKGLGEIGGEIHSGNFVIESRFEDIHSKIEFELVQRIGEAGKKLHTARSRNDQVLVDLHLYTKTEILRITELVSKLFDTLMQLAEQHKNVLLPGYTHLQIAMPSSFGLWFSAYAETLIDDVIQLNATYSIADQNPLGSAAGYGSSFPIDRRMTTELLGFSMMRYNVVAAQMSRGKLEKSITMSLASVASTLGKFASDVCLYLSQNFGFISFPKELLTGSSIMPHKQNPDVFELIRAKCNKLQALPLEISLITGNLTSGYHRDFQLLKQSIMEGIHTIKACLDVCNYMLRHIQVRTDILDDPKYNFLYSVDAVNALVLQGMNFRDAYARVGQEIQEGKFHSDKVISHTHDGSMGNLCLDEIRGKFLAVATNKNTV